FNWTFTLGTGLMDPWTQGATAVIPEAGTPITDLPRLLNRSKATIFAAAPGVYRKLLQADDPIDLPVLRHGLCAGEKLSPHLSTDWTNRTGAALYEAFGMSECSTFVSGSPANPVPPTSIGRPQYGRRVAIVDPDGAPVAIGEDGIIAVHASDPGLMLGYVGAPEDTAARFRQGWFLTGDRGVMLDDLQIRYLGRSDDMMNAGGYRVSPIEVETALAAYPGIAQVGVTDVAVRDDVRIVVAFYTARDPIDHKSLSAFAADRLARYKQPRAFVHVPELPTGANGKLLRRALRDQYRPDPI
ncbi:MAG: fatty acid--CoA ligase family protein, partial [Pseudomonadota bacterium]